MACTSMTAHTTNCYANSVCPYCSLFSYFHWPAQDISRFPKMGFELVKGDAVGHVYIKSSCGDRSLFGIPSQGHAFLRQRCSHGVPHERSELDRMARLLFGHCLIFTGIARRDRKWGEFFCFMEGFHLLPFAESLHRGRS